MNKTRITVIFTLLVTMLAVGPAMAQGGVINIKGEVISIGDGTLSVESNRGETFIVTVPNELEINAFQIGITVLIRGSVEGSLIKADILMQAAKDDDGDLPEGSKDNRAYCGIDKQPHPLVTAMAKRYELTEGAITEYLCKGYSMGAIMMALNTSEIDGINFDWVYFLEKRAEGIPWSQLWEHIGRLEPVQVGQSFAFLIDEPLPILTLSTGEPAQPPAEAVSEPDEPPAETASEPYSPPAEVVSEPDQPPAVVVSVPKETPPGLVEMPEQSPPGQLIKTDKATKVDVD